MDGKKDPLRRGYWPVAPGQLANMVVCLEMPAPPPARRDAAGSRNLRLDTLRSEDLPGYRALFRAVGEDWLWTSGLAHGDAELAALLADPGVEAFAAMAGDAAVGLLQLDFREPPACEIAYFGLVAAWVGGGAGRWLMNEAIALAWARPIKRLWLHTCSFDHPGALGFYQRSGFQPYAFQVEVMDDPRLSGLLPRHAAPHVPLIDPARTS